MMRWKVQLEGNETGLEQLSESFDEDPMIFKDGEEYYLWSSEFKQLSKSGDVRDEGQAIIKMVRHLGELDSLRVSDLGYSCVVEIQEDGSEDRIIHASIASADADAMSVRISTGEEELPPRAESTYEHTQLALNDDKVRELIDLWDNGDHWVNLYRVFEFIQDNIEAENNIVAQGWWSKSEKDLFKHTAQSPEAIGHEARHAKRKYTAPSTPMNHAEAKSLIENLIEDWLRHRTEVLESSEGEE